MQHGSTQVASNPKAPSLGLRMLAVFSFVMLTAAGGITLVVNRTLHENTLSERGEQLVGDAESLVRLMSADIDEKLITVSSRSAIMVPLGFDKNPSALQQALDLWQRFMPGYSRIEYANSDGIVVAATGGLLVGQSVEAHPWFQAGSKGPAVIDLHEAALFAQLSPEKKKATRFLDLAHPVRTAYGETIGVLAAHLDQDWLNSQLDLHHQGHHHVAATRHSVIGRSSMTRLGDAISEARLERLLSDNRTRGWFVHNDRHDRSWLVSFARFGELRHVNHRLDWIGVVQIPLDAIESEVAATRSSVISAISAITVIALLIIASVLRATNAPVQELMRQIQSARREHRPIAPLTGLPREFNQIQISINELTDSLRSNEARLELALAESQRSFQGVTESFPGVLFSARLTGKGKRVFTYLSRSAELYLGLPVESLPMEISALYSNITPESRAALAAAINEQARSRDSIDVMVSIKGGDSQVRTMQARAKKRRISDSEWTWDGVMVDVSDLIKAQQQAAAADFAKSDFLASMSHEIRTPLNGILGFAQMLEHAVKDAEQKADARRIIETAEMLTVILNDVLDYSKIEAGGLTLEHHPFDVSGLLDSCMTLFKPAAEKRGVQFTVRNECPHALRLVGDPTRLRQVITNLLSNAVKFTEEGSVDVHIIAESVTAEQVALAVTVTDTGRGISPEQQTRLFQRFDQVDRSIYRQYGGTGLGLVISKRLLTAMGGDISVTSALGHGSSFRFGLTLPVANAHVGDTPTPDQRSAEPLDILVVDDVAINRELLRRILGRDGHRVTEAASGEQAIAAASQIRFDLILMDIEMPGMDGLEACRKLRSGDGPNRATYVVALTGYAFDADIEKAMDAGMDAHMAKPIMMQALRAQIEKYRAGRLT